MHVFSRLGEHQDDGLDLELRGILKEKGLREADPFEELVSRAEVMDLEAAENFEEVTRIAAQHLEKRIPCTAAEFEEGIMEGSRIGATPITATLFIAIWVTSISRRSAIRMRLGLTKHS